jgi:transcriptional regulator NrdR family protein
MYIIKRDGTKVPFDKEKIISAINKAFIEVDGELYEDETAEDIAEALYWHADALKRV